MPLLVVTINILLQREYQVVKDDEGKVDFGGEVVPVVSKNLFIIPPVVHT